MKKVIFIFLISIVACLASLLFRSAVLFESKYYNVAAEAVGLYGILEVADGESLYPSKEERPFSIFLYNPLHAFFLGTLLKSVGISSLEERLFFVKALNCFLAAGLLLIFFYLSRQLFSAPWHLSLTAFLLSCSRFFDYIATTRHDIFALLLELISLSCFIQFLKRSTNRWLYLFLIFSALAFWTRQNSIIVFGAVLLWLLMQKRIKLGATCLFIQGLLVILPANLIFRIYGITFWDHVLFSNIRDWKPINLSIFSYSLLSFLGSIVVCSWLVVKTKQNEKYNRSDLKSLYFVVFGLGCFIGSITYFRSGGDTNYLFLSLFLGGCLCVSELQKILSTRWGWGLVSCQLLLIATIYGLKSKSAMAFSQFPFAEYSKIIEQKYPRYGYVTGSLAPGLVINLKKWSYHGPDISSGCMLSLGAHPRLHWLDNDLREALEDGRISTVVVAEVGCNSSVLEGAERFSGFETKEVFDDWLCVYSKTPNREYRYTQHAIDLLRPIQ